MGPKVKITNVSSSRVYLSDLRLSPESQTVGRGEDRYLHPGDHAYLPDTGEVLRSAREGTLLKLVQIGVVRLNDEATLASGGVMTLDHELHYMPLILVFRKVGATWVDATNMFAIVHDLDFTQTTVTNVSGVTLDVMVRCG